MNTIFVTLAVVGALAFAGQAAAQTVPYQSAQRASIGSGLGQSDLPQGGVFEPRIEAALEYAGNLNLAEDGQPQWDSAGLEVAPGLYASYSTGSVIAAIDYSLIGRAWEVDDYNDVSHRLAANGQWLAVPEWFAIRGQATYSDSIIDPRSGLNYGGLGMFGISNLSEVAAASINPIVQHRFSNFEFVGQYRYGRTWYLDEGKGQPVAGFVTGEQDSRDQSANVSFGTSDDGSRLAARLFYDWQESEYETALPYKFERAGLDAGMQISRTLTLVGDVGKESDVDASSTKGGLDSDFWSAGLRWAPNDRSSAEARYGERYFGESYSFSLNHRSRLLQVDASYSEQPTVETRRLSLGDFDPGELPTESPGVDFGRVNSSPYVAKNARVSVSAAGSRTKLGVTGFQYERDYVRNLRSDETGTGVAFSATRQLASNLSSDFSVSYSDYERAPVTAAPVASDGTNDYDTQATIRLNRKSGARLTLSGEAGYLTRSGDRDYDGWWVGVRARYEP